MKAFKKLDSIIDLLIKLHFGPMLIIFCTYSAFERDYPEFITGGQYSAGINYKPIPSVESANLTFICSLHYAGFEFIFIDPTPVKEVSDERYD